MIRFKAGEDLYATIGIPREETLGGVAQLPSVDGEALAPAAATEPAAEGQIQPVEGQALQPEAPNPDQPAEAAQPVEE